MYIPEFLKIHSRFCIQKTLVLHRKIITRYSHILSEVFESLMIYRGISVCVDHNGGQEGKS